MTLHTTVEWLPRSLARLVQRRAGSALANARSASRSLEIAIGDRAELTRLLLTGHPTPGPGGALSCLTQEECLLLLAGSSVGRLAYIARAGIPDIAPVNYCLDRGAILIRSGPGPKLQAAERRELVAFEVDHVDQRGQASWSVVVHGTAERVPWSEERQHEALRPWAIGPRHQLIRVSPRRITGRRVQAADGELQPGGRSSGRVN